MRFLILLTAVALCGCTPVGDAFYNGPSMIESSMNRSRLDKLQVGMARDQALEIMGSPNLREAYGKTEFLMYRTDHHQSPSEMTPIAIVDGKVTGWGRNYYDDVRRYEVVTRER